jgi:hypothetical protein
MRLTPALRAVGGLLEVVLLVLILGTGAIALRLAAGPIALAPFQPYIERLIDGAGPFDVSFANPALAWSRQQSSVLLQVENLEVRRTTGELVGAAPAVGLRIDFKALLRHRQVRLREVDVTLPALRLTRRADEHMVLSFGGHIADLPLGEATGGGLLGRLAGGADEAGDKRLNRLRRIRVTAASLEFTDEASGRVIDSGGARLRLTRDPDGWELLLDVAALGRVQGSRLRARALPTSGSSVQQVTVELQHMPLRALDGLLPDVSFADAAVPISAEIGFTFDPATLVPGPGTFRVTAEPGRLAIPGVLSQPLEVGDASLAGKAGPGWAEITIEKGELRVGQTAVRGTGTARRGAALRSLALDLKAEGLDPGSLLRLWPLTLAGKTRAWVEEHVEAGRVPSAALELRHVPGQPAKSIEYRLDFALLEGATRFLDDWPAATGFAGTGHLDRERFVLELRDGRLLDATASQATLTFTELRSPKPTRLEATLQVAGSVPTALDLLARKPLEITQKLEIKPEAASGGVKAEVSFALPLKKEIKDEEVTKKVTAEISELKVAAIRKGYDVTAGELRVEVGDATVTIRGDAGLNGVPARLDWLERLRASGEQRRVNFAGELNPERARALHLPWPDETTGPIPVTGVVTEARRGPRRIEAEGDLGRVAVGMPEWGLAKAAGTAGRLKVVLEQPDERSLKLLEADARWGMVRLRVGAQIALEPKADWQRIDLASVTTPAATLSGTLVQEGGIIRAQIAAERLDLRPYRNRKQAGDSGSSPDLDLDLRATRMFLAEEALEQVAVRAERRAGLITTLSAAMRLAGGGDGSFQIQAPRLPGRFGGETSDLGAMLRAMGLPQSKIERGRGRVDGQIEDRQGRRVWKGEAKLRELVVRDAPFLVRLLTLASLTGVANTLGGGGLAVDRITIPFVWDEGRIELRQARMVGSGLGARVDGTIDLNQRTLDLQGTLAPLYAINRLIGQIPLLGNLLRGDKADAAIAATFSVGGSFDNPKVGVNPLSALVPGFLRDLLGDLFEGPAGPPPADRS